MSHVSSHLFSIIKITGVQSKCFARQYGAGTVLFYDKEIKTLAYHKIVSSHTKSVTNFSVI